MLDILRVCGNQNGRPPDPAARLVERAVLRVQLPQRCLHDGCGAERAYLSVGIQTSRSTSGLLKEDTTCNHATSYLHSSGALFCLVIVPPSPIQRSCLDQHGAWTHTQLREAKPSHLTPSMHVLTPASAARRHLPSPRRHDRIYLDLRQGFPRATSESLAQNGANAGYRTVVGSPGISACDASHSSRAPCLSLGQKRLERRLLSSRRQP
jgi:hypothetical protein